MTLKARTRQVLERAAGLFQSGECSFLTGQLWRPDTGDFPERPEAACLLGAIFIAARATGRREVEAARAAVESAAAIWHGVHDGPADIVSINNDWLPLARTGPGLTFPNTEAMAANILKDAAHLTGQIEAEFPDTVQGADELVKAIQQEALLALETHGPIIAHDGFDHEDEFQD